MTAETATAPVPPDTFNASDYLLRAARRAEAAGRTALTGPGGDLTYAELSDLAGHIAAGLDRWDLRAEERVVLFMADGPSMAAAILGAMRLGAVPVPVSTMLTGAELAALLNDARARVLLVSDRFAVAAESALAHAPGVRRVAVEGGTGLRAPDGVRVSPFEDLVAAGRAAGGAPAGPCPTSDDSSALWLYTSGTTGKPKGAMHRHANIRHVVETYGRQVLGITPEDRCYSVAKLFFAYGIGNSLFFPLAVGATAILDPDRPTPASVAERLAEYRPTLFFAVPTFYAAILNAGVPVEAFASVRLAVSAGEPLPAELCRRFTARYGVEIIDGIGSTECLHIFLSNRPGEVRPGTTGTAVPGYELRVVDGAGADVPPGTPGSLLVKGESIATGYWCRTETTRQVFQGEWLRTGDTYVVDEDGYYTCLGRTGDMLKAGGIWVSPAEVEGRLLEHPAVAMAAVVGLPDADGLDKPIACVVLREGAAAEPAELIEFCRAGLASFKRPREVLVVDKLPTTPTGKLRRFAVRELAATLLGTP
ncbi:benzoate-CoA ligase family protein [Actinomadura madurae]|uniref:benzoate-CoA ligase family protein n=1 Tax=Actinomadura madurae TaxID=1993 RepID=UPI002026AADD|nr:benzoate-CoA ligase family protein [Actinomadura madurae]MCP9948450.1 benzoate-CoA ligase family protein [Actinomadura madurae]MCP9977718.1 benzoate-CoA ligase family protein [Actinomadura madurae]MCQ0010791.1 benzoate-CoA ligase family protein [Actinomadura madurae]MCQ0013904.1 benzoate-CoA ligase family protein [Actinomadura madurae]URN04803.1 benzoate-CoA ligase family protein [Actinomadura madurae]